MEESSNMNKAKSESMRWHLVFKEEQMKHMASGFYYIVGNNSHTVKAIAKALDKNNVDKVQLFLKVTENFFYGYLSFPVNIHLYSSFFEFF